MNPSRDTPKRTTIDPEELASLGKSESGVVGETLAEPFSVFTKGAVQVDCLDDPLRRRVFHPQQKRLLPSTCPRGYEDLGASLTLMNLTATSDLVVAGIAPAFKGDLADQEGRRPAHITMVVLTVGSGVGLALQDSYSALFALRMMQSAG